MIPIGISIRNPVPRVAMVLVLLLCFTTNRVSIAQVTYPSLRVAITQSNQNLVLSWFGSNAIPYQVESSSTLAGWTNFSSVFIGSDALLVVTNPILGQPHGFYRVKQLMTGDPWSADFDAGTGILTIIANDLDNLVIVSRDPAGTLKVNDGTVPIAGGVPTVANTVLLQIFGRGGNDQLSLDESNGALPKAKLYGEAGDDTLVGGSGADELNSGFGNDILVGGAGIDTLLGGDDKDTLMGGDGDDQVFGEAGNDTFVWNPGDDTDLNEGGDGTDTVQINGGNGAETFTVTANGTRVRFDRLDPAPFFLDIGTCEHLEFNAHDGNDTLTCTGNLAALIQITADGGAGDDTLLGSNGADVLLGGDGHDFIDGQQGNDVVFLGAGDDTFQWDPGDGSDTVEGQSGSDRMVFNGSGGAEIFEVLPNGGRVRFTRNLGGVVMDLDDVESLDLNALGNTDTVMVNDLGGTDLTRVNVDLAATLGASFGDAQVDAIIVNATSGNDNLDVFGAGSSATVAGLLAQVNIMNSEGTNDSLVINALGGADGVVATTLPAGIIKLTIDGGDGDDSLLGSQGADVILGGGGDDFISGDNGDDLALMGADDDVFQWDPGDGNDTVEGQTGADTLLFFGSNASENIDISANGSRVRLFRDVASVTMDLDDIESINIRALGGTDNVVAGDLSLTDLTTLNLDLSGPSGGGDLATDTVTVNATQGADVFGATGDAAGVAVSGLHTTVNLLFQEQTNDRLTLNAFGGDDVIDATNLKAAAIQLTLNGGLGADVLLGGEGDDLINGGDGNDAALMGAGNDTFTWNPGDDNDTIEGQSGFDRLLFNGSNGAENISIAANGSRVLFFRDVASVTMDLNDTEAITYNALGGADTIVVNDLAATYATTVDLNLAAIGGAGDAAADSIIVQGTAGDDVVLVNGNAGSTSVLGLNAKVNISGAETANDRLTINALAGNDVVDASALAIGAVPLTANGGLGNDILHGGAGIDTLLGGDDNDTLTGGDGDDQVFGEVGNDTFVWNPGDDTDLNEGGDGTDTVQINGGNGAETFTVTANGTRVRFDRLDPAPFFLDIGTCEHLEFNASDGNDTLTCTGNLAALIQITADGGAGDDTLLGSNGADVLLGGDGHDFIDGQQGNDVVFLGAGDDTFQWDPGDGSDTVEGQSGSDRMVFNGSGGAEIFEVLPNGGRVRFTRNLGGVVMDLDDVESLDLNALGNTDTVMVNDLGGTDLTRVNVDLAATLGGSFGDAQVDTIIVNGTASPDTINITANAGVVEVSGLAALVRIEHPEVANDQLTVNGHGGTDTILTGSAVTTLIRVTVNQ